MNQRLVCFSVYRTKRLITAIVLASLGLSLVGATSSAAPLEQETIHKVYITDVRHTIFVVSWTTESPCTASVTYGTSPVSTTWTLTSNDTVSGTTHYVVVSGLTPDMPYYFDTLSGGVVDDNNGAHYTVKTGRVIPGSPPGSFAITGTVYLAGGILPAADVIVYLQVQNAISGTSQLATSIPNRTAANGGWGYNLSNLRTADNQSYFTWSVGDIITLTAQGGVLGTGQITPTVPAAAGSVGGITLNSIPNAVGLARLEAHASTTNIALPLLVVGLLSAAGLLFWRRKMTQM
jgi:hypothetical protein